MFFFSTEVRITREKRDMNHDHLVSGQHVKLLKVILMHFNGRIEIRFLKRFEMIWNVLQKFHNRIENLPCILISTCFYYYYFFSIFHRNDQKFPT